MRSVLQKLPSLVLAGLGVAALASPARAQTRISPGPVKNNFRVPTSGRQITGILAGQDAYRNRQYNQMAARSAVNGFRVAPAYNPYYGSDPYGYGGDPYGGYLSGVADVINSQGQVAVSVEQARMMHEQLRSAKIDTKRKAFDQYLYERKMRPTEEDERERARIEALRRVRNGAPPHEIYSGGALNTLLLGIQRMNNQGIRGPDVPLEPDYLRHINVTGGSSVGTLGLLKDGGKLQWPLALKGTAFGKDRQKLDQLAGQAFTQAQSGQVSDDTLQGLIDGVDALQKQLKKRVSKIDANAYIKGKRFLNEFEGTIKALQDPNVSKFASGQFAAKGKNVYELVMNMTRDGLKFAPATVGGEPFYTSVYQAMVSYYQFPDQARTWDTMAK